MPAITIPVGLGSGTGVDPSQTRQLQESVGVVYRPGDPAARKFPGRTVFNGTPVDTATVNDVVFTENGLFAAAGDDLYVSNASAVGIFTDIWDFPGSGRQIDAASLANVTYIVCGQQNTGATAPFGALAYDGSSAYRMGLAPVITGFPISLLGAGLLPGPATYHYWVTEYDHVNAVESAYDFPGLSTPGSPYGTGAVQPVGNDTAHIVFPTQRNATATKWRLYRTIDGGTPPIGWLVAEIAIATLTYDDQMTDATLVLQDPYRIITINGISESMDIDPQALALTSIESFQGSLVAIPQASDTSTLNDLAYTPAQEPHSWPLSYRLTFPTKYSGSSRCVRKAGDALYVSFPSETFLVNYLPDESDAVFSPDIAIEHVANYGTPSPTGMCSFTAWGGFPVLFIGSLQGPILIAGKTVDRAVKNIDWASLVSRRQLGISKAVDNPDKMRVEFYYRDSDTDSTSWKCLHFYYDGARVTREVGSLPELAWTGPHAVPGPGCYAVSNNAPKSFTAGHNAATGFVYVEDSGTVDTAHLIDSDGAIQFRLRTPKVYPGGIDAETRADRVFISRNGGDGEQDYTVTFNAHRENGSSVAYSNITIAGNAEGVASNGLNASLVSFDVRVVADGTTAMAPINNITVRHDALKPSLKTTTAQVSN